MAIATLLDPELGYTDFFPQPLSPEQIRAAFKRGNDVGVVDLWADHLLLAPHGAAVRPLVAEEAGIKEVLPVGGRMLPQALEIMTHLQQVPTTRTTIDDILQAVMRRAPSNTLEPGMIFHSGRRLSGNGWHDASFVCERVRLYTQHYTRCTGEFESGALPRPAPPPLPSQGEGGQRAGSGQEIKGCEGINASSFDQSDNVYVLVGLMRLFRQPGATDDHRRLIGGDKHRTVSRIRGCRRRSEEHTS